MLITIQFLPSDPDYTLLQAITITFFVWLKDIILKCQNVRVSGSECDEGSLLCSMTCSCSCSLSQFPDQNIKVKLMMPLFLITKTVICGKTIQWRVQTLFLQNTSFYSLIVFQHQSNEVFPNCNYSMLRNSDLVLDQALQSSLISHSSCDGDAYLRQFFRMLMFCW